MRSFAAEWISHLSNLLSFFFFFFFPSGSDEEHADLLSAYLTHAGSLSLILSHVPHSTSLSDETRFVNLIDAAIASSSVPLLPEWTRTSRDGAARTKREKEERKESKLAEEAAKELGVWDEFYGAGEKGARKKDQPGGSAKGGKKGAKKVWVHFLFRITWIFFS